MKKPTLKSWAPAVCVAAVSLAAGTAEARPYASGITNNSGVVSFLLNESADNVKVIFNGGASTNDLGARDKGAHTFNLGGNTSFEIHVTKNGGQGYMHATNSTNAAFQQISSTTNTLLKFWAPRGVAVNANPESPAFGRVYVGNSIAGTPGGTTRFTDIGLFILNSDESSAHVSGFENTALNPGFQFGGTGFGPWKVRVGDDSQVYVADCTDQFGNVLVGDPDINALNPVLKPLTGSDAVTPVGPDNTHGSIMSLHVEGSLADGNLTIYTIDEDLQSDKTQTTPNQLNSVWRYNVGAGPLPYEGDATKVFTPGLIPNTGINSVFQYTDVARGSNGYFYYIDHRSDGTDTSGLVVLDANGTHLWNSRHTSTNSLGLANDVLRLSYKVAVSRDQKYLAVGRTSNLIWIIPLVNGIPDLTQRLGLLAFGAANTSTSRQIQGLDFDAAGNLYAVNSSQEILRVFAPGGTATTVTSSDGDFRIETPQTVVSVTAAIPTTTEGSTAGRFTVTRTGDTASSLSIGFTISGTATNGTDYVTIGTNVTFGAGVSSVNVDVTPINDSVAELTETVSISLLGSSSYSIGSSSSASVSILDNEPVEISIAATQPRLLEAYAFSKATYQITRRGLLSSPVTVTLNYSGATSGTHFAGPTSASLVAGGVTTNVTLTSINNNVYEGDKQIVCSIAPSGSYSVGAEGSAVVTLYDDEFPAGQELFADNFQTPSASNWLIGNNGSDNAADFEWNYATYGIPVAPGTTDGSTKGLRLRANVTSYTANAAINAFPTTSFSGDYRVKFDMWLNYNGPMFQGGAGSTMAFIAGLGATAPNAQVPTLSGEGVMIKAIIEGQDGDVAGDYSAYNNAVLLEDVTGFYPAGTNAGARNSSNPYYSSIWGGTPAPAAQLALHASQTGNTEVGCIGMAWHTVVLTKSGNVVTWTVDGITMASVTNATAVADGNAFVGFYDPYSSASPELCFAVVDNFRVETLATAPVVLGISRSGNNVTLTWTGPGTLQQASVLTGSPSDWSDVENAVTGHTVNAASGIKFYRLRQ